MIGKTGAPTKSGEGGLSGDSFSIFPATFPIIDPGNLNYFIY